MYEYTDKVIAYLTKRYIRTFEKAKSVLLSFDELHTLSYVKKMYNEMYREMKTRFLELALKVSAEQESRLHSQGIERIRKKSASVSRDWLLDCLVEYDPITEYVFDHEVDRKGARCAESVISRKYAVNSPNLSKVMAKHRDLWIRSVGQEAITITDKAVLKTYREHGVEEVEWITQEDGKVCADCDERNHKVYAIDKVPPKPHWGCRCYLIPHFE